MAAQVKPLNSAHYTVEEVREIGAFFRQLTASGVTASRLAYDAGISEKAFADFLEGITDGATSLAMDELSCRLVENAEGSGFAKLPSHRAWWDALEFARSARPGPKSVMANAPRGVALIFGDAGMGKTTLIEAYADAHNRYKQIGQLPVLVIEVPGGWRSRKIMMEAIVIAIGNELKIQIGTWQSPENEIREHIPLGGIIIFDQAHRLSSARLDELTYFTDQLGIAIGLVGNLKGYAEFCRYKLDSLTRRVNGRQVPVERPTERDVVAILEHEGIRGEGILDFANLVAAQSCGIDRLFKTCYAAKIHAAAYGLPVDLSIFKKAAVVAGAWGDES